MLRRQPFANILAIATGAVLLSISGGCEQNNPNAQLKSSDMPIVTSDSPKSSEEAAARSEPPPVETREKKKSR